MCHYVYKHCQKPPKKEKGFDRQEESRKDHRICLEKSERLFIESFLYFENSLCERLHVAFPFF